VTENAWFVELQSSFSYVVIDAHTKVLAMRGSASLSVILLAVVSTIQFRFVELVPETRAFLRILEVSGAAGP
jgi:hypothetical protein